MHWRWHHYIQVSPVLASFSASDNLASKSITFFWRRITDVHFFSKRPLYFLSSSPGWGKNRRQYIECQLFMQRNQSILPKWFSLRSKLASLRNDFAQFFPPPSFTWFQQKWVQQPHDFPKNFFTNKATVCCKKYWLCLCTDNKMFIKHWKQLKQMLVIGDKE